MLGTAYGTSCTFRTEITYPDNTKGCLDDLVISKEIPVGESSTILDLANKNHFFVIARSKAQSCKAIGIAYTAGRGQPNQQSDRLARLQKEALDKCFNAGCDCEIVISNNHAEISRAQLETWGSVPNATIKLASEIQPNTTNPDLPSSSKNTSASQKSANTLSESEQLIALKKELEELRATIASNVNKPNLNNTSELKKSTPQIYANRYALVIGNDSYQKVPALQNAREDAKAMASNLDQLGYKTTLKLDLNEKQMRQELRNFKSQLKSGDEVTFYYAGHGVQIDSTNFLLPVDIAGDSEDQVKDEAVSLQRVLDDMSEKKVKFTLALVDACRDNPFKGTGRSIAKGRGLAPTTAATGQMIVFSAGTGQQALDKLGANDKSKNGLFTRVFMAEMHKEGVSIDRIVRNVRSDVVALAKSVGHDQVPAIYDQVVGEFFFKK